MKHLHFLNTVGKKYTTGYVIMGFFVLVFLTISAFESFYVSDNYSRATSELVNVNKLESSVNSLNETVNMAYLYLSSEGIEAYDGAKDIVENDLGVIRLQLEEEYIRELADTENTVETYLEQSSLLIGNLQKYLDSDRKDTAAYVALESNYANVQATYNYVNQMFQEAYTAKLADFSELEAELKILHRRMYVFQAVLILAMVIFCTVYLYKVIREVSASIRKMKKGVESIRGNVFLAEPIKVESNDEFEEFAEAFNGMIKLIQAQMNKIKENADVKERLAELEIENLRIYSELQKSHLNFLQSRINPHFLFNTLNMISSLARIENADKCADLMEITASFLRYNLDNISKTVTLEKEIENLKDYVAIQEYRYDGRYQYSFDISQECLGFQMPCMVLQPLVENSIQHGIAMMLEGGHVWIRAYGQEGDICLEVSDNGVGMTEARIQEIYEDFEKNNPSTTHIGLRNIYRRLKLFYSGRVKFQIENLHPGLEIMIRIYHEG